MLVDQLVSPQAAPHRRLGQAETTSRALALVALCVFSALLALKSDASPTGSRAPDVVVIGAAVALAILVAPWASWWTVVVAGLITALAAPPAYALGAVVAVGIVLVTGWLKTQAAVFQAVAVAAIVQAFFRLGSGPFHGSTALIAAGGLLPIVVTGLHYAPSRMGRWTRRLGLGCVVLALSSVALLGVMAYRSWSDIQAGQAHLQAALSHLQAGDTSATASALASGSVRLKRAENRLDSPVIRLSAFVPGVAQHRRAALSLVRSAQSTTSAAAQAINGIDNAALQLNAGEINLDAVRQLAAAFKIIEPDIARVAASIIEAESPWLVPQAQARLTVLAERVATSRGQARVASNALERLPDLLGSTSTRRYLIGFGTPGEARGLGLFVGNWAEIDVRNGRISLAATYRTGQLAVKTPKNLRLNSSDDFKTRYARFGAATSAGFVHQEFWSNVSMSPDMPSVAQAVAQMYSETLQRPVDGVFTLDPTALAGLLKLTGPVDIAALNRPVTATDIEQYLLVDQYNVDDRVDLLETISQAVFQAFLTRSLPNPTSISAALSPTLRGGNLQGWLVAPAEQNLMRDLGMAGELPALDGRDGVAVVNNNAGPSKIDTFLGRAVSYNATHDVATGDTRATLTVDLTNAAPTSGYPDYVIGNMYGLAKGTNRTFLSVYSALDAASVALDDSATPVTAERELGWNVYSLFIDIAPGQTRRVVVELTGQLSPGPYALVSKPQPETRATNYAVTVNGWNLRPMPMTTSSAYCFERDHDTAPTAPRRSRC